MNCSHFVRKTKNLIEHFGTTKVFNQYHYERMEELTSLHRDLENIDISSFSEEEQKTWKKLLVNKKKFDKVRKNRQTEMNDSSWYHISKSTGSIESQNRMGGHTTIAKIEDGYERQVRQLLNQAFLGEKVEHLFDQLDGGYIEQDEFITLLRNELHSNIKEQQNKVLGHIIQAPEID